MGSPLVVAGRAPGSARSRARAPRSTLIGAGALALEAWRDARARGRWTTDPGWHLVAEVGLLAGVAWFVVGIALASWRVVAFALGLAPDAWSTPLVGAPLAVGWVVGVLIASWTHLLPSIGPGGPPEHAAQRRILGRAAPPRVFAFNLGVLLLAVGWPAGIAGLRPRGSASSRSSWSRAPRWRCARSACEPALRRRQGADDPAGRVQELDLIELGPRGQHDHVEPDRADRGGLAGSPTPGRRRPPAPPARSPRCGLRACLRRRTPRQAAHPGSTC